MSILNVILNPDRVTVACDSDAVGDGGKRINLSKALSLPHMNCVVAIRGSTAFFYALFMTMQYCEAEDYDGLALALPKLCAEMYAGLSPVPAMKVTGADVVLCGYSASRNRMAAVTCIREVDQQGFVVREIVSSFWSPWDVGHLGRWPKEDTSIAGMVQIVRSQVRLIKKIAPDSAGGGNLVITEATRDGVRSWVECELTARVQALNAA